jgi:Ca2+/Na+ antiporter
MSKGVLLAIAVYIGFLLLVFSVGVQLIDSVSHISQPRLTNEESEGF